MHSVVAVHPSRSLRGMASRSESQCVATGSATGTRRLVHESVCMYSACGLPGRGHTNLNQHWHTCTQHPHWHPPHIHAHTHTQHTHPVAHPMTRDDYVGRARGMFNPGGPSPVVKQTQYAHCQWHCHKCILHNHSTRHTHTAYTVTN